MSSAHLESLTALRPGCKGCLCTEQALGGKAAATYQGSPFVGLGRAWIPFCPHREKTIPPGSSKAFLSVSLRREDVRAADSLAWGQPCAWKAPQAPGPTGWLAFPPRAVGACVPNRTLRPKRAPPLIGLQPASPYSCGMPMGYPLCPGLTSVSRYPHFQVLAATTPVSARKPQLTPSVLWPPSSLVSTTDIPSPRAYLHQIFHSPPQVSKDGWTESCRPVGDRKCRGTSVLGKPSRAGQSGGHEVAHGALGKASFGKGTVSSRLTGKLTPLSYLQRGLRAGSRPSGNVLCLPSAPLRGYSCRVGVQPSLQGPHRQLAVGPHLRSGGTGTDTLPHTPRPALWPPLRHPLQ